MAIRPTERADVPSISGETVCTACPLLCDDVFVRAMAGGAEVDGACDHGRGMIVSALARGLSEHGPEATIDGRQASRSEAVAEAAGMLAGARRVLVTGLADAMLDAQRRAADLAECVGGAFDTGALDGRLLTGPTIARAGEVTAQWEELRDRADLAVLWFVDPSRSHPRFIERFLAPAVDGRPRTVLSVGDSPTTVPEGMVVGHLPAVRGEGVGLARALEAEDDADPRAARILAAIGSAACVAFVTESEDVVGIERWAIARLVRRVVHRRPAFEVPLGAGLGAGGGNPAGAAAVATWRHGAAGAIARASDLGGRFEPAEADGVRLVQRREVDVVLVVGDVSEAMRRAVADAVATGAASPGVVWIGDSSERVVGGASRTVFLRSARTLLESAGEMLREDGRLVAIRPIASSGTATAADLLGELVERLAIVMPRGSACHDGKRSEGGLP